MKPKSQKNKSPYSYQKREYRTVQQSGLVSSYVRMVETDLHILAPLNVEDEALLLVSKARRQLEGYIRFNPSFVNSLKPLPFDDSAPLIVKEMLTAGLQSGVGPMAAVAGAIAEAVGNGLRNSGLDDLIVENGGDIFISRKKGCTVAVYSGTSPLSNKIGIRLSPESMPCGICCSSATIGHSLSFGHADAVVVTAPSTTLADAMATRIGNEVQRGPGSIDKALQIVKKMKGISGTLIVQDRQFGLWGEIEIVPL